MRRMVVVLACMVLIAAGPAAAGTRDAPELTDPTDDVAVYTLGLADEAVPAVAPAADLEAVWFTDDKDGLWVHFQVADLSAIMATPPGPVSEVMWMALWQPGYADATGAAGRVGMWQLRAEYFPFEGGWHFWMERPCRDGDDDDGCAGSDRDILDGLTGIADEAASQIHILAPWRFLADPAPGDGIHSLIAHAASLPSYPVYLIDLDMDEWDQCYVFENVPVDPSAAGPKNDGPTGSSNGRIFIDRPTGGSCPATDADGTRDASASEPGGNEVDADREAPGWGAALAVAALVVATWFFMRRR